MAKYKLHVVFLEISFFNFPDDSLEVDYENHFIFVAAPTAEIHPPALELVYTVRLRLKIVGVVDEASKPFRSVLFQNGCCSSQCGLLGCCVALTLQLALLCLAELDQFAL